MRVKWLVWSARCHRLGGAGAGFQDEPSYQWHLRGSAGAGLAIPASERLRLVAEGCPTREVARRLCYSERTIKNVIHDVVTKLNVRTRSQAVAHAVREGLI